MADLDGDGWFDLVSGGSTTQVLVHPGLGTGLLGPGRELARIDRAFDFDVGDTSVALADWDRDGRLDVLAGTRGGKVLWVRTGGLRPVAVQAGGRDLQVGHFASPCAGDWDGDGDLDLVVGDYDGDVRLYRNAGGKLGEPELLLERAEDPASGPQEYAHPALADWNADGRLDLLVGDNWLEIPVKPLLLPEQQDELEALHEELRQHGDFLHESRARIGREVCFQLEIDGGELWKADEATRTRFQRALEAALRDDDLRTGSLAALQDLRRRIQRLEPRAVMHGRVWLCLRGR